MGVLGLTTWVERSLRSDSHRLKPGSVVVIDGLNWMAASIAVQMPAEAERQVSEFMAMLRAGGIEPLFVFDGAAPVDKMPTIRQRATQRNQHVKRMLSALPCEWGRWTKELRSASLSNAPYATVVIDALQASNAHCFFCVEDADILIASLATWCSVPILSNDSDFLLLPCPAVIRADSLRLVDDAVYGTARCAEQLRFALRLPSMDLLPLFGALLGNDYIPRTQGAASGSSLARQIESCARLLRSANSVDAALASLNLSSSKRQALVRSLAASRLLSAPAQLVGGGRDGVAAMLAALHEWDKPPAFLANVAAHSRPFFVACRRGMMFLADMAEDLREHSCWVPSSRIRALAYAAALLPVGDTQEDVPHSVTELWRQPHGSAVVPVDARAWDLPGTRAALMAEPVDARWRRVLAAFGETINEESELLPPPPKRLLSAVCAVLLQSSDLHVDAAEAAALSAALDDSVALPAAANPMVRRRGVHLFACVRATLAALEMLLRALHLPLDPLIAALKAIQPKRLFVALDSG